MDALVSTDWLAGQFGSPDLVVLDASLHLPQAGRDAEAEFEKGHIPGARFLHLAALHDPASSLPGKIPEPDALAERLSALGAEPESRIVLYDDSALRTACRAWALLRFAGLEKIAVLDGGFAKWRSENRAIETGPGECGHGAAPDLHVERARLRDKAQMLANCADSAEQVIDARDAGRFAGTVEDTVHNLPGGHIPGACNLPFTALFREDGTFKPENELRTAFEDAGIDLSRPIVTSCGSGVTASVLIFALHLLGIEDAALYDGSWSEWGADPETPKATGVAG
ncbi:sulfurtransferase [Erythrobacter litoralis]|uniref:Sulfurtransferase n=1 Tax=Erythrobacter litoralis (strain HTCC2594) TaxID=314225 RepID=Q2NCW8_ERYLH|nr:sulfurtransferase [Erythrobacter litoralis]ABC62473.1 thiosulfate sulfurtransferase, putative [Erythrobacter litoralis HTCC2594]